MDKLKSINIYFRIQIFLITSCALFGFTYSEKILLLPHLQGSHVFELTTIGEQLVENGHEVHCVVPRNSRYMSVLKNKRISALTFESEISDLMESDEFNQKTTDLVFAEGETFYEISDLSTQASEAHCEYIMNDLNLLDDVTNKKFDLAIVDWYILGKCLVLLPHKIGIPYIGMSQSIIEWDIGVPYLPSFMFMAMQAEHKGTLLDKMTSLFYMVLYNTPINPIAQNMSILNRHAPGIESYRTFERSAKLFVIARNHILEFPSPTMPNVVRVPGYSYRPPKALPTSISGKIPKDKRLIVVSFGSTVGNMPKKAIQQFLYAFATFPDFVVIWKLPNTHDVTLPSNVIALPWLPQNDALGHNQTALFITHCGANGLHEAMYHGVPLIGFPMFAEQHHNAKIMSNKGYGLSLDIKTFTVKQLVSAMHEILNPNAVYKKRLEKVSAILHDRAVSPREEIAYWIEHVMKYGDDHIRSVSIDMPLYELYMLDIVTGLLVGICIFCFMTFILIRCLCGRLCGSKEKLKTA